MRKSEHPDCSHVVDLDRIAKMIVEAYTRSAVNDHVKFFGQDFTDLWYDAQAFLNEIALNGNDTLFYYSD